MNKDIDKVIDTFSVTVQLLESNMYTSTGAHNESETQRVVICSKRATAYFALADIHLSTESENILRFRIGNNAHRCLGTFDLLYPIIESHCKSVRTNILDLETALIIALETLPRFKTIINFADELLQLNVNLRNKQA